MGRGRGGGARISTVMMQALSKSVIKPKSVIEPKIKLTRGGS